MNTHENSSSTLIELCGECPRCNDEQTFFNSYCNQCGWIKSTGTSTHLQWLSNNHEDFEDIDVERDHSDGVTFEAQWEGSRWRFMITYDPIIHDYQIHAQSTEDEDAGMWTPGSVDEKEDAIAYVLDVIGLAEDCGDVQPSEHYTT